MAEDLADRISDGAVAVLELVPGEQRFADLSRFVLKGGASRFAPVVLDDEPIRYVLPVGVPGHKLDFGTLLIQQTRCALVWRTDPARPYHAMITTLGPETSVKQSPATVRGDVWGRFDLRHPGTALMTFLVPPVASPELPKMLHRVLVTEPRAQRGDFAIEPLNPEITENPRSASEPEVVLQTGPVVEPAAAPEPDASGLFRPGRRRRTTASEDHTQVLPAVDDEATQVFAAFEDTANHAPIADANSTAVLPPVDVPTATPVPRPAAEPRPTRTPRPQAPRSQGGRKPRPVAPQPTPKQAAAPRPAAQSTDALYRSEPRPPGQRRQTVQARPTAEPRPAPSARRDEVSTQVLPAANPGATSVAEPAQRSFIAEFIPGVLMGLAIVAALACLYFLAVTMGFLH